MRAPAHALRMAASLACLAATAAPLVSAPGAAAAPSRDVPRVSAKALSLTLPDVTRVYGRGFKQSFGRSVKRSEITQGFSSLGLGNIQINLRDFLSGYESNFENLGLMAFKSGKATFKPGVEGVSGGVDVFKSSAAPSALMQELPRFKFPHLKGFSFHISNLGLVGDQSYAETTTFKASGIMPATSGVGIIFRRGRYTGTVFVTAVKIKAGLGQVLTLAKTMDARFKVAG